VRVSIFGLGYVGAVSAGCIARAGHTVIGVDPNMTKVDLINAGRSPVIEKDIDEIIGEAVADGRLRATNDVTQAIAETDISLLCVGTPSQPNGNLDLTYVRNVCEQIGSALRTIDGFRVIVARSTMLPGSMRNIVIPTLEDSSGKTAGGAFGVCNNPEFLREGTAVHDFYNPPKTVIGETDEHSGELLAQLYAELDAPLIRTDIETAEMVKYTDNVWHALKVAFANEIGNICKGMGIDSHRVMEIFCQDTKLNLSPYYLRPGFAFGGSCLPKDLRALNYKARTLDLEVPVLSAILPSNQLQVDRAFHLIQATNSRRIGILGFSFKAGTDDLRESPIVELIERLIGKGYDVHLYDRNVNLASLVGANRDYILNHIPHIAKLMRDSVREVLDAVDIVVVGNAAPEFLDIGNQLNETHRVIDLVRIFPERPDPKWYQGICW